MPSGRLNRLRAENRCAKWASEIPYIKRPDDKTLAGVVEAMMKYDDPWWEATEPSAALGKIMLQEPLLLTSLDLWHKSIELFMGRPVWTHETAHPRQLLAERRDKTPASMQQIIEKLPANKTIIIAV